MTVTNDPCTPVTATYTVNVKAIRQLPEVAARLYVKTALLQLVVSAHQMVA